MNCPVDGSTLQMADRSGVEIDYCPTCRGVWLDRGELDKIIERSGDLAPAPPRYDDRARYDDRSRYDERPRYDDRRHDDDDRYRRGKPHKKKGGFLSEMFDFD